MFNIDEFIGDCLVAVRGPAPALAVKEVLERAVSDPAAVTSVLPPTRAELQKLHVSAELTVLTAAWAPGMTFPPHDHRMWAAIGVYTGQEDNAFYRRAPGGLLAAGGRQVCDGDVLLLGDDTIHAVSNPRRSFTAAIHVYGGDLLSTARSEWDPATLEERPYDLAAAFRYAEEQNAKLGLGSADRVG
jgi:predicted metal-dependent enzyme (double-stranded beta helix superfamily)